jgi:hypothetical protein
VRACNAEARLDVIELALSDDLDSMRRLTVGFVYETVGPRKYRVVRRLPHTHDTHTLSGDARGTQWHTSDS